MALTRDSINIKYNAQIAELEAQRAKEFNYRAKIWYYSSGNRRINRAQIAIEQGEINRRYRSKINFAKTQRTKELHSFDYAAKFGSRPLTQRERRQHEGTDQSLVGVVNSRMAIQKAQAQAARNTSKQNARSNAIKAEQNRQIALRESQIKNKRQQIIATTKQNQKVRQNITSAGYAPSKLKRAELRPSPRTKPVSNPAQRKFAKQQVNRPVSETVRTSKPTVSKPTVSKQVIRATETNARREKIIADAKKRYQKRQQSKLNPALTTAKPMKFPKPISYSKPRTPRPTKFSKPTNIKSKTIPGKIRNPFDEFSFKKPEPKLRAPHLEYGAGFVSGVNDLYITGKNIVNYAQGKEQIPLKGNPLDNLLFAGVDAGVESYEKKTDFMENFNARMDTVTKDMQKNPWHSVGASVPSALIIAASVVVPPLVSVKYGGIVATKAPKIASAIQKGAKVVSNVPAKIPRSLNKGKFGIGDPVDFARATRKVPKIDKNKIRTSKATSYKVNPNLLIRKKGNITSKEISKGIDMEPRTLKEIFGGGVIKTAKGNSVRQIMADNKKVSDKILNLGNKANVKQPHFNSRASLGTKTISSGKQQLMQKAKQKNAKIAQAKQRYQNRQKAKTTSNQHKWNQLIKNETKNLQNFYGKTGQVTKQVSKTIRKGAKTGQVTKQVSKTIRKGAKTGQVTKQVSKTIRKGAKTGSKNTSKGAMMGVRVGASLGLLNAVRAKPKQKVKPLIGIPEPFPQTDKTKPVQGIKPKQTTKQGQGLIFTIPTFDKPLQITDPIIDVPEKTLVPPILRPPTTKNPPITGIKYPTRRHGSGYWWSNPSRGKSKKGYRVWEVKGVFEKSRIGIHYDSPYPVEKIPKSKKRKSPIIGMLDYGQPKKKAKKKSSKKAKKKSNFWDF